MCFHGVQHSPLWWWSYWYHYVAVASAFIPYVHASATLLDPCMYIHFLQSLSIVLHLCLKINGALQWCIGQQCLPMQLICAVWTYVRSLYLPVSGMCTVSKLCKRLSLIFPPNCVHLPLCCGESIIISEGRFPECVDECVSVRGWPIAAAPVICLCTCMHGLHPAIHYLASCVPLASFYITNEWVCEYNA